jgi:hypothetical protein
VRGGENTLEHYNQVRREEEEGEMFSVQFLRYDQSVFKPVFGGSNVLGSAQNSVSLFPTLNNEEVQR